MGLKPTTSTLRVRHATHCATPPLVFPDQVVLGLKYISPLLCDSLLQAVLLALNV